MRDYYFMVHPPKTDEDDEDFSVDGKVVDFDKMDVRRRTLMRTSWGGESFKGDST